MSFKNNRYDDVYVATMSRKCKTEISPILDQIKEYLSDLLLDELLKTTQDIHNELNDAISEFNLIRGEWQRPIKPPRPIALPPSIKLKKEQLIKKYIECFEMTLKINQMIEYTKKVNRSLLGNDNKK